MPSRMVSRYTTSVCNGFLLPLRNVTMSFRPPVAQNSSSLTCPSLDSSGRSSRNVI